MEPLLHDFEKNGWFVLNLPDPTPVFEARLALQNELVRLLGKHVDLEEYHTVGEDDSFHTDLQYKITTFFRENRFAYKIISSQLDFFKKLLGLDLFVQKSPYLRMTRPNKPQDNIGYHRDTFYGGSPYELSVLVPFVDLDEKNALKVLDGSHTDPDSLYPVNKIDNPDASVVKGSKKHQLGFLYAPKVMDPLIDSKMHPVPLKVGQVLIFSLSTVHGTIINTSSKTRWSSDMRVMSALAPVDLSARPEYYEPLHSSIVTACAKQFFENNVLQTV